MTTAWVERNMVSCGNPMITQRQLAGAMRRATILRIGTMVHLECNIRGERCDSRVGVLGDVTTEGMILAIPTASGGSWRMFVAWTDLWAGHTRVVEGQVAYDIRAALDRLGMGVLP